MAFDVNVFRSQLVNDGARANLFDVQLAFPSFVNLGGIASQKVNFMAKSAQMPGASVGMAPLFYFGREVKLAGNRTWQDWTIQVINDEDFIIRNAMEQWINGLNNPVTNVRDPAATIVDGGYGVDALVTQYGKDSSIIKQYSMIGMFPIDVSAMDLDWGSNDNIQDFVCTLAYQYGFDPNLTSGSQG